MIEQIVNRLCVRMSLSDLILITPTFYLVVSARDVGGFLRKA